MVASPRQLITYLLFLVLVSNVCAYDFETRQLADKVQKANEAFANGKVDEALKGYTDAQLSRPDSPELQYNIGSVHYKKGAFKDAAKAFEGALLNEDKKEKAATYYNLGNTYFREGASAGNMELFKKAIENYKKSLAINPDDVDAKYNIEYIQRKLKENSQRQQQKPQDKQQKQDQKQQQQQQQQQNKDKQDKQDKQKQQQQKQEQQKQDQQKQNQQKQEQQKREKLDPEQAKRWLDRLKQSEKDQMKKHMKRQRGAHGEVSNDW